MLAGLCAGAIFCELCMCLVEVAPCLANKDIYRKEGIFAEGKMF